MESAIIALWGYLPLKYFRPWGLSPNGRQQTSSRMVVVDEKQRKSYTFSVRINLAILSEFKLYVSGTLGYGLLTIVELK